MKIMDRASDTNAKPKEVGKCMTLACYSPSVTPIQHHFCSLWVEGFGGNKSGALCTSEPI